MPLKRCTLKLCWATIESELDEIIGVSNERQAATDKREVTLASKIDDQTRTEQESEGGGGAGILTSYSEQTLRDQADRRSELAHWLYTDM